MSPLIYLIKAQTTKVLLHFLQKTMTTPMARVTKSTYCGFHVKPLIYQLGMGLMTKYF